jgi:hypothetical protein
MLSQRMAFSIADTKPSARILTRGNANAREVTRYFRLSDPNWGNGARRRDVAVGFVKLHDWFCEQGAESRARQAFIAETLHATDGSPRLNCGSQDRLTGPSSLAGFLGSSQPRFTSLNPAVDLGSK